MKTPRIDALDLRDPMAAKIAEATAEYDRRQAALHASIDRMWNWPAFPVRVERWIATGRIQRYITVTITGDTTKFNIALKQAAKHMAQLGYYMRGYRRPWWQIWR